MKKIAIIVVCLFSAVVVCHSQGTFQNLDFEAANVSGYSPNFPIPAADAIPDWQASQGVVYDGLSGGGSLIAIIDSNPSFGTAPLDGNYSVYLFGGGVTPNLFSASISQTGGIPPGTESIQLDASYFGAPFAVTVGGTTIDMVPLHTFVHYTLWGGNVPASLAGETETLTITEPPPTGTPPSGVELDDISFSPNPITVTPEPSPLVLTAIGGILFGIYRRFAEKGK